MVRDNSWLDGSKTYEPQIIECNIDTIDIIYNQQVHYKIQHRGFEIELFAFLRPDEKKLILCGQDAIQRHKVKLPYFYRWSWYLETKASFITISDPTLYMNDKLDAGWYQGFKEDWALQTIGEVLKRIEERLNVVSSDVLLYGVSAGGFWAMMTSTFFPRSRVMVEIPQIDLFTYTDNGPKSRMFDRCFKGRSEEFIRKHYSSRLRVIDRWRRAADLPSLVIYYQNIKDYKHTRTQMEPFWDEISKLQQSDRNFENTKIEFRMFNRLTEKGGHIPMHKDDTTHAWQQLMT